MKSFLPAVEKFCIRSIMTFIAAYLRLTICPVFDEGFLARATHTAPRMCHSKFWFFCLSQNTTNDVNDPSASPVLITSAVDSARSLLFAEFFIVKLHRKKET
jgi:hypothetical protein